MRGDEVDAGVGPPAAGLVQVARAREPRGQLRDLLGVAAPEPPDAIAVLAVPLGPPDREVPDLVAALAQVPWLGDQLDLGQFGVLLDDVEEGPQTVHVVELPGKDGRQVETEAVHVHLPHPVPEAVHNQLDRPRVEHVEAVARPGEVHVEAPALGLEPVEGCVVHSTKRQCRAELVPFSGVVVDHVHDDLDARPVQALHHGLEFGHLLAEAPGCVPGVGGEESDRVVPPVVREAPIVECALRDELMDRHQLHGGDPERPEVIDDGVVRQPQERPADPVGNLGLTHAHATNVALVDDRLVPGDSRKAVVAPRERVVHDHALGHASRAVPGVEDLILLGVSDPVSEHDVARFDLAADRFGVGIEQELVKVEPVTFLGCVRPIDPESVELAGLYVGQVAVPDQVGSLSKRDPVGGRRVVRPVEKTELDTGRMLGEDREVDAFAVPRRTLRIGPAGPDPNARHASASLAGPLFRKTQARGGSVRDRQEGRPWAPVWSDSRPPRFPQPVPP